VTLVDQLNCRSPSQWRAWLKRNHRTASEVWLVFDKKGTGSTQSLACDTAFDEAFYFGWIDSLDRRLDERRCAQKFTPRKPLSKWPPTNKKRMAELAAAGGMETVACRCRGGEGERKLGQAGPAFARHRASGRAESLPGKEREAWYEVGGARDDR
jgi:hypothetical protein